MTYSVGNSTVADYANTSTGKVTNVVADDGLGGLGVVTDVTESGGRVALSFVVATSLQFLTVDVTSLAGYTAGSTDITITVNPNVYVYGYQPTQYFPTNPPLTPFPLVASMQIIGGAIGDTIKLVNNGYIIGGGGDGAGVTGFESCPCCSCQTPGAFLTTPAKGNAALSIITPGISLTIENNGAIAGGGGGGGIGSNGGDIPGGGGGAGGGVSGKVGINGNTAVRAVPPSAGSNGNFVGFSYGTFCQTVYAIYGGGGGFVLPGTGGVAPNSGGFYNPGNGGGSGGGGSSTTGNTTGKSYTNSGGSGNNPAPTYTLYADARQGGGGGGWGAAGAAGYAGTTLLQAGAVGGNSIITNGNAYTLTGSGLLYGTVDTTLRSAVITYPTSNYAGTTLEMNTIPGFTNGMNIVVFVPANVTLASTDTAVGALTFTNLGTATQPTSVRVVINGYILAAGGRGGSEVSTATTGGTAIQLPSNVALDYIIDNTNGYLVGGGGGGGRGNNNITPTTTLYGGGGAGYGGSSGVVGSAAYNAGVTSGVSSGTNGQIVVSGNTFISGGSGGTILPGTRTTNPTSSAGTYVGLGGSAGGSGASQVLSGTQALLNYGGAINESGGNTNVITVNGGGGGGGWGAQGGGGRRGTTTVQSGGSGGRAVKTSISVYIYVTNPNNIIGIIGV
jgi:hypothetical protein